MLKTAVDRAIADAGLGVEALRNADVFAVVGFTVDASGGRLRAVLPPTGDPPGALARHYRAAPRRRIYTTMGGNTPQALVNWACEQIANGEADLCVLAGAEFLGGLRKKLAAGADVSDYGAGEGTPERWGDARAGCSDIEAAHGLGVPANVYPMFENALRARLGRSIEEHQAALGALFAPFTKVAAANPHAWFPTARSAEELSTPGPKNRMVGFPYPKYLNSIIEVDQSAALILASSAKADELGVAAARRVYLHGCAEAHDLWNPLDRENYWSSPAIRTCAKKAFAMAGKTPADLSFIDLYSCFPVAVEIACAEIGLATDDPRGLTVTGGLPYFGGPGNNYVMHSIAEMMSRLRAKPGSFGLATANGWFLTKHAMGIYSTTPTAGGWRREDPKAYQRDIDAGPHPALARAPQGAATIEAYTVTHAREGYRSGIVIGRDSGGARFVANTPSDEATLRGLESREGVGRPGVVSSQEEGRKNLFVPA
jgi:acetyl-CoA C-acetyltransferase